MQVQDILTDMQNNTAKVNAEKANQNRGKTDLGQDAFLQLLMTQLKYQDPMNPVGNQEFIAQQAQFTQISELQKLNDNFTKVNNMMQASSLIGKEVTVTNPDDSTGTVSGVVSEAKVTGNDTAIVIGDKEYPLNLVQSIKEVSTSDAEQG